MTAEKAIEWLELKSFNRWRLFKGPAKVDEFDPEKTEESADDALEKLAKMLGFLDPGNYVLKGWYGKGKQASQYEFSFKINSTPTPAQNNDTEMTAAQMEELISRLRKDIGEQMRFEQRIAALENDRERYVTEFKKFGEELVKINGILTDDDDENDGDGFERLTELAEKIPGITKGLASLSNLGKAN